MKWVIGLGLFIAAGVGILLAIAPGDDKKDNKVVTTDSGLKYEDLKEGDGDAAKKGDLVEVHYTGWLAKGDGKGDKFDSSEGKEPFAFKIGKDRVIKGWHEGLVGMKVGGKRKLIIPPELGYGKDGFPPKIPGDATLIFEVELLKIRG
jgi:FKBP-type peptidyl-prolyl cis-trans isomerase